MENKFSSPLIIDSEDNIVIKAEDSTEVAKVKRKISVRDDLSDKKIRRKSFELGKAFNQNEIEVRLPFEANLESAHFKDISGVTSEEDAANAEFPHFKSSEDLSLKELLSDVIEFEETPKGVAVHKIKPRISIRDHIGNISGTMSFKELLSDVMQLEQTPYEGVIPPRKFKSESFKSLQTPSKKRNTFTLQMKINLLNELDSGVKLTKVAKKYDVPISTLSTIYRDRHKVRSAESMIGGGRKRIRMGAYQNVDEEVLQWYWNETREGRKPNGPQIQEKAREIAHLFGEKNFEGSAGWLKCFKDRYGLSKCRNSSGNESGHEAPENINSEVGLARANVCIRSQSAKRTAKDRDGESFDIPNRSALTQDLKSKGGGLRRVDTVGDLVEVRYIARVLDDAVLHGEVIDSNEKDDHPLCLKVKDWWKTWKEEESNLDISDGEDRRWWEGALWGATVGTRRMIVVPPEIVSKMKGLKVKLSPDACLVYEVEVLQIRRGIGVEESKHGQTVGDAAKIGKSIMSNAREQEGTPRKIHMPGCSLSSVVTSTPSGSPPVSSCLKDSRTPADKASILSRMARMGQPTLMLPDLQARRRAASEGDDGTGKVSTRSEERSSANEEDSADVEVELEDGGYILPMEVETMPISAGNRPPPPRLQPRPIGVPQVQPPYQSSVYWHSPPQYSNVPTGSSYTLPSRPESTILGHSQQHQQYSYPSHSLALTGPSAVPNQPAFQDPHLSVFLSETRTQNAELRMAMGRLTDKVDAIMGKLDRSPQQQQQQPQQQQQQTDELRLAFEKDRAEWKEKEERLEKELAEAKLKLSSKTAAEEEKCKSFEKENNALKKEVEDALAKLASVQNNRPNEISDAVKSAMNSVYSHLQPKFSNGVAYEGLVVRKTLAATIREVTLQFLSSNNEEKGEESELHKGTLVKEVSTIRRKGNKPELKAKPDGRKILLRKGSSPRIDVEASPSSSHHSDMERNVGNSAIGHKESSKHTADELSRSVDSNLTQRDGHETKAKEEGRSRVSSREGSLERVVNPEPPSPPIFDAGELSESGEEWLP